MGVRPEASEGRTAGSQCSSRAQDLPSTLLPVRQFVLPSSAQQSRSVSAGPVGREFQELEIPRVRRSQNGCQQRD